MREEGAPGKPHCPISKRSWTSMKPGGNSLPLALEEDVRVMDLGTDAYLGLSRQE